MHTKKETRANPTGSKTRRISIATELQTLLEDKHRLT